MRFFVKKKSKTKSCKVNSASIITACMEITGDLNGSDTIHIAGKVIGDITVENALVIGKTGVVIGNVKAKNAVVNGDLQGELTCESLEIMQDGKITGQLNVKHLVVDGKIDGEITGVESISILKNAKLNIADTTELLKIVDKKMPSKRTNKKA